MGKIIYNGDVFGGAMTNMRYNPETDMVEIYYNGIWKEWKSGNIQATYLYRDGEQVVGLDNTGALNGGGQYPAIATFTLNENTMDCNISAAGSIGTVFVGPMEKIDLSNYNRLYLDCNYAGADQTYSLDLSNVNGSYYIAIGLFYIPATGWNLRLNATDIKADAAPDYYFETGWNNNSNYGILSIKRIYLK